MTAKMRNRAQKVRELRGNLARADPKIDPRCQFNQQLLAAFTNADPKSVKQTDSFPVF